MEWKAVRELFPDSCVLIEALQATSVNSRRILQDVAVISDFPDGDAAWKVLKKLQAENPSRELYIVHTCHEEVEIIEQRFGGVRRF